MSSVDYGRLQDILLKTGVCPTGMPLFDAEAETKAAQARNDGFLGPDAWLYGGDTLCYFAPNWVVARVTDEQDLEVGTLALVYALGHASLQSEVPFVIPSALVLEDVTKDLSDDEIDALEGQQLQAMLAFFAAEEKWVKQGYFTCDPITGVRFFEACWVAGYRPEIHGYSLSCWVLDRVARLVKSCEKR
jgi:hypothetical protein